VVGYSKSGKTTLIEYLISHLTEEGLKIGTVKHVHHSSFTINAKGKDTWRHSKAGAQITVCVAPEEVAIIEKRKLSPQKLEEILCFVDNKNLDLVILEGFHSLIAKRRDVYKVLMAKNEEDLKKISEGTVEPRFLVVGPLNLERDGKRILEQVKRNIL
jgi:molybdopterin-guanine dinucleotide biosynthesis protein MobB